MTDNGREFLQDPAFRLLLVISLFGILFWTTLGHALAYYSDYIRATYGSSAYTGGFRFAHMHSTANSLVAGVASIALPLITSIKRKLKTFLALLFGLSLISWNVGYIWAGLTTTTPTTAAFNTQLVIATNYWIIPISWLASIAGGILFLALLYDLIRKRPLKQGA